MTTDLELTILDGGAPGHAVAVGRCGSDVAIIKLPYGMELDGLANFRSRIDGALRGRLQRPDSAQLAAFGVALHQYVIRDDLKELYRLLSPGHRVRIHLLSDRPELQSVPWEFLQEPGQQPGPRLERSVARIVPTIGLPKPEPRPFEAKVRVLFVCAEPQDQEPVSWPEMKESIERTFKTRLTDRFEFKAVEAADKASLIRAVTENDFDIFHFSGHGLVRGGVGNLVLVNRATNKSSYVAAPELAGLLGGRRFRLAVLSACETSSGDFSSDFSVLAETLVRRGFPAVVANQFPLPDTSAAIFAEGLYNELLRSGDIDHAVSEARVSLAFQLAGGADAVLEWGIPTLYRRLAAGQLFRP